VDEHTPLDRRVGKDHRLYTRNSRRSRLSGGLGA